MKMSLQEESGSQGQGSTPKALGMPSGKTCVASPKMTSDANIELDNSIGVQDKLPLHEDIMQLARLVEIGPIQKLFEEGKFDANHKDHEGITPLHVRHRLRDGISRPRKLT